MLTETAPAKINLALHVRRRRADGYHDLETLFAFLEDGDRVSVAPAPANGFAMTGPFAALLAGDDNLVTRARDAFEAVFATGQGWAITLDKHLPVASGIGGGSADAAATLRALARLSGVAVDDPRLFAIAERLGADVPACLLGRTAIGTGKGEQLVPIAGVTAVPVLLVNPGVAVSTAAVFKAWDGVDRGPLAQGDALAAARAGRNDLEPPARALAPGIDDVLAALAALPGVVLARMSGSGATCFALFDSVAARRAGAASIRAAQPGWWCLESALA
ncbi:4-(cytidine 5'-diphospho)-2-C-methyl-D-erythritol kinase [Sphingomonas sp.]|uniref:4-(cytidine 5'-diphospho)-2-C-methyl-D-erythritol kinase n=1 Tax=Sphingomonas sp. TaxID=28214 RepID=UPI001E16F0D3|nr:4-(cytidine 5'-diphospho)-2-C-methyl-D-erythritol kinase [Sphingomonas sp.]MBX9795618.1 4-(cytidine 5'-diphospho)-2-C-methyl-D-erythritol kinase [Sphingomonas sp.]